jgi:hypothetical protein
VAVSSPAVRRGDAYVYLAVALCAVEFVGIAVASALYAGVTEGWRWAPLALVAFPIYITFTTAGVAFAPALVVAFVLNLVLRRASSRALRGSRR